MPEVGSVQAWLDEWVERANYSFSRDQIETIIAAVRREERQARNARAIALLRKWRDAALEEDAGALGDLTSETTDWIDNIEPVSIHEDDEAAIREAGTGYHAPGPKGYGSSGR